MGKIIRNGVEYSGATEDATAVNYDNSLSGLNAQTVQEGIDEVSNSLGGLEFTIVDGKPHWKERGADSFSPFSSGVKLEPLEVTDTIVTVELGYRPKNVLFAGLNPNTGRSACVLYINETRVFSIRGNNSAGTAALNNIAITFSDTGFTIDSLTTDHRNGTYYYCAE